MVLLRLPTVKSVEALERLLIGAIAASWNPFDIEQGNWFLSQLRAAEERAVAEVVVVNG